MTEEEARTIMKAYKWTYHPVPRRSLGTKYIYAQRREGRRKIERYICPLSKLPKLTEEELIAKLTMEPA
jgi:hypothetical protein